jgi:hypothetical protein
LNLFFPLHRFFKGVPEHERHDSDEQDNQNPDGNRDMFFVA